MSRATLLSAVVLVAACGGGDDGPAPAFPADYAATYVEVRDCRMSSDHDLRYIRVVADPAALAPYRDRAAPFPDGAIVLKEEYEFTDTACAGPVLEWTAMRKDAAATDGLGWTWQRVDAERAVIEDDPQACVGCHEACGQPPDGYDGTCAVP